jgi:hypothetical protein
MKEYQDARVQVLRNALDEEVHGLWISNDMAVRILACLDKVTPDAMNPAAEFDDRRAGLERTSR